MDERRALLKELANSSVGSWAAAHRPAVFDGQTRVETRNTVYQFLDGVCFAVSRRDEPAATPGGVGAPSTTSDFVGMRIVGWLIHGGEQPTVVQAWRPGAYAVLWRQSGTGESSSTFALTSQTTGFVPCIQPPVLAASPASKGLTGGVWAKTPPSYAASSSASPGRVDLRMPTPAHLVAASAAVAIPAVAPVSASPATLRTPPRPVPAVAAAPAAAPVSRKPSVPSARPAIGSQLTPVVPMPIPRMAMPTGPVRANGAPPVVKHVPVAGPKAVVPSYVGVAPMARNAPFPTPRAMAAVNAASALSATPAAPAKPSGPPPLPARASAPSSRPSLPVNAAPKTASAPTAAVPSVPRPRFEAPRPRTTPASTLGAMRAPHPSAATI